jgi:NifU-like protein involved in Fe-S cluster formation
MSDLPYSTDVLRLAVEAIGAGRLAEPRLTHTELNPACGDRITIDLHLNDGRIAAAAHDTKACVLTQASASVLGSALSGLAVADIRHLREEIEGMLKGGPPPSGPFERYACLADVARHPGRHRCVLLPIDAAIKALESKDGEPGRERP